MGVKGLWKLLLPIGRRISLETLRGQVLAIDASIWLTQFLKAMRDPETGQVTAAAHLIGYMRRICRLLFHQIRPVFVFDGRAPEIKRRELLLRRQRRNEFVAQEENIQRYARKLIHETLLRHQQNNSQRQVLPTTERPVDDSDTKETGAFVRGFHPGGDDGDLTKSLNDKSETDKVIDLSSVAELDPGDNWKPTATTSDWDVPLAVAAMEEAKELDALESADQADDTEDDEIIYEDFIPPSDAATNPWSRKKKHAPHLSSVAEIASLPPSERKDAIETVQRQRRLQSRKEFIPAAHDPVQFSNVQLSNFLKSCQLNKDIVSMAKQAVQQQSEADGGGGELMASDRTTRVELIRENRNDSVLPKASTFSSAMWHTESIDRKKGEASETDAESDGETRTTSSSDDTDSKIQWGDPVAHGDNDAVMQKALWDDAREAKPSPKKRRHIVIDDDEDDEDHAEVEVAIAAPMSRDESQDSDDVDWEDGEDAIDVVELPRERVEIPFPQSSGTEIADAAPNTNRLDGYPDEGEVDWEDGDDHVEVNDDGDGDVEASVGDDPSHCNNKPVAPSIHFSSSDPKSPLVEVTPTDSRIRKSPVFSKGTSDALIHAQATAAQLTNWAGRAFRRAIVEANGGHALEGMVHASSSVPEYLDKDDSGGDSYPEHQSIVISSLSTADNCTDNPLDDAEERAMTLPNTSRINSSLATVSSIRYDAAFLERNDAEWTAERNRRERDMETISDDMLLEVKQLLQLFGIPYIEAPSEAEAQCAVLESLGLVDGIVTEDSDVFVFGGKKVYKNIFEEQKYAEVYDASDAEREMKLGRNSMVALAMLLGGDYTEGVKGVGIVNAMEVLDTFDVSRSVQDGLRSFRTWLDGFNPPELNTEDDNEDSEVTSQKVKESAFHVKHMSARTRWTVPQNFPAENVIKAYIDPVVDKSTDPFTWGAPDFENIITFCNKHIGWAPEDTKRLLEPVLQARNGKKGMIQTRIDSYMRYEDGIKFADVRSKRLRDVLGLQSDTSTERTGKRKHRTRNTDP